MNTSNIKMTIIAIAVSVIGGGGYFGYKNINKMQSNTDLYVSKFQSQLPSHLKLTKSEMNVELMQTTGSYQLSYSNPIDPNYNGDIIINYIIPHTISLFLSGDAEFTGDLKLNGKIASTMQIKGDKDSLATVDGTLKSDGSLNLNNSSSSLTFILPKLDYNTAENSKGVKVKLDKVESSVTLKPGGSDIAVAFSYNKATLDNLDTASKKMVTNKLSANYQTSFENLNLGKLKLKINDVDNLEANTKIKTVDFENSIEHNKDDKKLFNLKFKTKLSDMEDANKNISNFEINTSLNQSTKDVLALYQHIVPLYFGNKQIKDQPKVIEVIKNGLNINVESISYKDNENEINASGQLTLNKQDKDMEYSLAKLSKIVVDLKSTGNLVSKFVDENNNTQNEINVTMKYEDKSLKIDGEGIESDLLQSIVDTLDSIGVANGLQIKKAESAPVAPATTEQPTANDPTTNTNPVKNKEVEVKK